MSYKQPNLEELHTKTTFDPNKMSNLLLTNMLKKLEAREREFRTLTDNISDFLVRYDKEGRFVYMNKSLQSLLKINFSTIKGKKPTDILGLPDAEFFEQTVLRIVETGVQESFVHTLTINGNTSVGLVNATPEIDDEGDVQYVQFLTRDITEQKQMEKTLRETNERFTQIYDNSIDVIYLIEVTPEGHFIHRDVNAAYERVTEISREAIIGVDVEAIGNETFREILLEKFNFCLKRGEKCDYVNDYPFPSGTRTFHSALTPMFDENGRIYQIVGVARDITEQKEGEKRLQLALEFNEEVMSTIPDLMFELDAQGVYKNIWAQDEKLLAAQKKHLLGKNIRDVLSHDAVEVSLQMMGEVDATGQSLGNIMYVDLPEGRKYFELSASMKKSSGTYIVLSRDITERKRSEDQLQKTKAKLSAIITSIPDLIWVKDLNGVYMMCNASFENFFGAPSDEIIGKTDYDFVSREQADFFRQKDAEALASGEIRINEEEIIFAHNGQKALLETRKISVYNGDEFMGILGIGRDVTERKNIEQQLADSHNFLRQLINAVPDPIFVKDRQHRWNLLNHAMCTLMGETSENLLGKSDYDFFSKEEADIFWAKDEEVFISKEINVNEENLTSDGEKRTIQTVKSMFVSDSGDEYLVGTIRDITKRKHAEEQQKKLLETIRKSEEKLSNLYMLSPLGIALTDMNGQYIEFNDAFCKICGYTLDELQELDYWTLTPIEYEEQELQQLEALKRTGRYGPYEKTYRQKNGNLIPIQLNGVLIKNENGDEYIWSIVEDITERKRLEQKILTNQSRLNEAQKIAKVGSWELEFPGLELSWSDEIYRIFEIEPNSFQPSYDHFLNIAHPEDRVIIDYSFHKSLQNKTPYDMVHRLLMSDGRIKYVHERGESIYNPDGIPIRSIGTVQDVTEQKTIEKQIEHIAHHDPLTDLPNRILLEDRSNRAIAYAKRNHTKTALLFIDLDEFKVINDSLGHSLGDEILKQIAVRLGECLRETDTLGRLGGDEFIVILSNIGDEDNVTLIADKLLKIFDDPFEIDDHHLSVSSSIGIALYPDHGESFESLLQNADAAMHKAKELGKNGYCFYSKKMNHNAIGLFKMRNDLRSALEFNEFILHYQPQIDLANGAIIGAEALIRWNHPQLGMTPPMSFIPIAESSGLIVQIGEWVIHEACRQAARWQKIGIDITVAVNISSMQFKRGNLESVVKNALASSQIDPKQLELELTESIIMHDTDNTLQSVRNLKALGVQLSIDDFGTGYSSLAYLKRFAVDKLKIDQSFVRDILCDQEDAVIVETIIQMAKSLNLKTIAEGVEDAQVLSVVESFGCDEVQGYHFAKPLEASDFEHYYTHIHAPKESL